MVAADVQTEDKLKGAVWSLEQIGAAFFFIDFEADDGLDGQELVEVVYRSTPARSRSAVGSLAPGVAVRSALAWGSFLSPSCSRTIVENAFMSLVSSD